MVSMDTTIPFFPREISDAMFEHYEGGNSEFEFIAYGLLAVTHIYCSQAIMVEQFGSPLLISFLSLLACLQKLLRPLRTKNSF